MTKKALCLDLLRKAGERGVTTAMFLEAGCGSRFGARIQELRGEGHEIVSSPVRAGSAVYKLTHDAEAHLAPVVELHEPLDIESSDLARGFGSHPGNTGGVTGASTSPAPVSSEDAGEDIGGTLFRLDDHRRPSAHYLDGDAA